MRSLGTFLVVLISLGIIGAIFAGALGLYGLWYYGKDLPEYRQLQNYQPPTVTRVHAGDGRMIAEYFREHRIFVPEKAMPLQLKQAIIAVEDQNFYHHYGIDPKGVLRAVLTNIKNYLNNKRLVGASTITQQVAKNFLLSNEKTLSRKIREAILALRLERVLSKERILELYLNEIYLGQGAYGFAAAALRYFDKALDQLTLAEIAYLAGLPKAPENYHPMRNYAAAIARRNWTIKRMLVEGYITPTMAQDVIQQPLVTYKQTINPHAKAGYFVEEVRRVLGEIYGVNRVNEGGFSVRTTLDTAYQTLADRSLRDGLIAYDRRHGYRGPFANSMPEDAWLTPFKATARPKLDQGWVLARITAVEDSSATLKTENGKTGILPLSELTWAGKIEPKKKRPRPVKSVTEVLAEGDVVAVEKIDMPSPTIAENTAEENTTKMDNNTDENSEISAVYGLRQIPKIEGGLVAIDPHTGRILAMSGGWSYKKSQFNRVTQAKRQPGSAFKPFVYLAALDNGHTPATMILDAPFVLDQGPGLKKWKPANYSRKFYGPSPMRIGIEKSRNLMTVRLAQSLGMNIISSYSERFNIMPNMPQKLSMALGAGETSLMNITVAYAMLVNGGKLITPTLIDRVQDRNGKTIFIHDRRQCKTCLSSQWENQTLPVLADNRKAVTDPASAYQIVKMLEGVVKYGTGRKINALGRSLAGKTGTTNDSQDTWFVGFSPDLAVGVYVGFDAPKSLGRQPNGAQETGSSVAVPIFKSFMEKALRDKPDIPFRSPDNVRMARIDRNTGQLATATSETVILEAFKSGTEPYFGKRMVFIDGEPAKAGSKSISGDTALGEASAQGLY